MRQSLLGIGGVIQRARRVVPGEPPETGVLSVLFLQVGAVAQDDGRQGRGALRALRRPGEPVSKKGG
jgi:hypothetical protein